MVIALTLVLTAGALSGCGGGATNSKSDDTAKKDDVQKFSMSMTTSGYKYAEQTAVMNKEKHQLIS